MMKLTRTRLFALIALVIVIAAAGAGIYISQKPPLTTAPTGGGTSTVVGGGTLTVGSTEYPGNGIGPYNVAFDTGFMMTGMVYEGLTAHRPDGSIAPNLASSWTSNPDYTVWTFNLRHGVKFHDGTPFNATAAKTSLDLAIPSRGGILILGPYIKDMKVIDEFTLQFTLKAPYLAFPGTLGAFGALIVSPSSYAKNSNQTGMLVNIGTGPWRQVQWIPNDRVILEANTNYWNASRIPKVKTFVWKFFTDANAMVLSLKSGAIDVAYFKIPQNQLQALAGDPNIRFVKNLYPFTIFLTLNLRSKPLDNLYVRKAMAYALDYDQIQKIANGTRAYSVFPPQIFGQYDADAQKNFTYSPAYAKQLMTKAGYPNGYNGTLTLTYAPGQFGPEISDLVTVIQRDLGDIGLKVNLNSMDQAALLAAATKGQLQMAMFQASTGQPDPDYLATISYQIGQFNADIRWGFRNETATQWVADARSAATVQERVQIYHKLQNTFDAQPSQMIFLYSNLHYVFFNQKVHGLTWITPFVAYQIDWTQVSVTAAGNFSLGGAYVRPFDLLEDIWICPQRLFDYYLR